MKAAAPRANESAAIAALRQLDVLDSAADAELDALVQAASLVCGTPISLISLIDEHRQWFKASVGLPGVSETPRDMAFCAHAVLGDALFEVPETLDDDRFADNPLVTGEPNIRFYAGVPLTLAAGERVGTLCVIDRQPRRLDDNQRAVLRSLGLVASRALETRRTRRELAAALSEGARALLVETHSADAIIGTDAQGRVLRWNPAATALYGYTEAQMLGHDLSALRPPDQEDETAALLARPGDKSALTFETLRLHRDGHLMHVSITAVPELDAHGQLVGVTKFVRDISARVEAARQLKQSEARARRMYESTPAMLHSVDREGRIIAVSDQWLAKLGYERSEVIGKLAPDLLMPESRERALREVLPRLFAEGRVSDVEYQVRTRDHRVLDVLLSGVVDRPGDGRPATSLTIMQDVSAQREADRRLREATARAEAANQAKSQFLANMSHEIRTPMNAVIGLSYLLERSPLDAQQADTVAKIKLAGKSLLAIINDVLDLSKIEAAEMHLERSPFSTGTLLSELTALTRVQTDAKGIAFVLDAPDDLPAVLEGDATRLRQVLTNLLSNAVKFTAHGAVHLGVRHCTTPEGRVRLHFSVRDTGVGVAPENLARLFNPFVQADTSTTRRFGGTGLGLSIVKQLVGLMGGEVDVRSTPGEGSEFTVTLELLPCAQPLQAGVDEIGPAHEGARLASARVLVVDDSPINLEVAQRILELEGAHVVIASNGQEAVDLLLESPHAFDVVLMDVQMPVVDGHDATRRIRSGLGLTALPVIALTAGISSGEHQRALAAGMNDMLIKPFDPRALVQCIYRHAPHLVQRADAALSAPAPQAGSAPAWPPVVGIDAADVSQRLGGDVALFRSLLRRLVDDFDDIAHAAAVTPEHATTWAPRLHAFKGCAGALGARGLERLAGEVEASFERGHALGLTRAMAALREQFRTLQRSARRMLGNAPPLALSPSVPGADQPPLDPAALGALLRQLRNFDLGAIAAFQALLPPLAVRLGEEPLVRLHQHIDELRFAEAVEMLEGVGA
ncbi:PAS domain S-box protein [Dyella sp.]|uniref:PAS domain S-box protein n=1 Tax=Dyella sp. TaxID=1869338 RepID=UPI002D7791ED|nr:PAS domain S-box protein [Dyella sp.]HET6433798.1 PAS domain S-box protein [Dyella sp.]